MGHVSQVEWRLGRALERSAERALLAQRPSAIRPERCFTAVDPAGTVLVKFTRRSRRGVQLAIASHLAGYDDTGGSFWPKARRAGWSVASVALVPVALPAEAAGEGGR